MCIGKYKNRTCVTDRPKTELKVGIWYSYPNKSRDVYLVYPVSRSRVHGCSSGVRGWTPSDVDLPEERKFLLNLRYMIDVL